MNQKTEFKGFLESTLVRSSREGRIVDVLLRRGVFGMLRWEKWGWRRLGRVEEGGE